MKDESMSDEEAARQRDEVVRRMLNTPPQPRKAKAPSHTADPQLPNVKK